MNMSNGSKPKIRASLLFALAGWGIGCLGLVAFFIVLTENTHYTVYLCLFSSVSGLLLLLGSLVSIAGGGREIVRDKQRSPAARNRIQSVSAIVLGCLGFLVSVGLFAFLAYFSYLYSIWHY